MKVKRILVCIVFGILAFFAAYFNIFGNVDKVAEDMLYHHPGKTDSKIKIIKIDDRTINQMGDFSTWNRDVYADLIDTLCVSEDIRPAVIGFDILFSSDKNVAGDKRFAEACAEFKNVITGFSYDFSASEKVLPYDSLLRATGHGFVNAFSDSEDGFIRSSLLYFDETDGFRGMSFGGAVYVKYMEVTGGRAVYSADGNVMNFRYSGESGDYESFSLSDVLQGEVAAEKFDDCIVLVGAYAADMQDSYFVPVDRAAQMYGVEIHANVIQALMENKTLMTLPAVIDGFIALIIVVTIMLICENLSTIKVIIICVVSVAVKLLMGFAIFNIGFSGNVLAAPAMSVVICIYYIILNCYRKNNNKIIAIALATVEVLLVVSGLFFFKSIGDDNKSQLIGIVDDSGNVGIAHTHSVEKIIVEATCSDAGVITQVCSECNEIISIKEVPALGHDYAEEFTVDEAATCTTEGSKSKHCKRCDAKGEVTVIAVTEHKYAAWETTLAAGCVTEGKKERSCESCGHTEEGTIKALGHRYSGEFIVDKSATCTTEGSKHNYCVRCNAKGEKVIIEPVGHEYEEWEFLVVADCEHEGKKEHSCKNCGYKETVIVEALGHVFSENFTIDMPPTCTGQGSKSKHCLYCKERSEITVVKAKGHVYKDEWIVVFEPGCELEGTKVRDCLVCEQRERVQIAPHGHEYEKVYVEGTDTENGHYLISCRICKQIFDGDELPD